MAKGKKTESGTPNDQYEDLREYGRINARIIDAATGLRVITGVYVVRMKDDDGPRIFMNDYVPTIGKLYGSVTFLTPDGEVTYSGIEGFYKLQHNEFTLLVDGKIAEKEGSKA